ncbi:calmodulin-like protein 7 [Ananas comosus]|uniref:Calmodulin-like protein 7 n=1 Tax=Ananas comosus TaxID=4615 RepID=A0A6P5F0S7_ANACO|nr:calmodulin-like protein 7 [Ananas comosus]
MTTLLLFAILFICGLLNSYLFLFSPSKLFAWICSLLPPTPTTTQTKPTYKASKKEETEEEERVRKVAVNKVDLKSVFATFDHDCDGFVTSTELEESFRRLGLFASSREVMHMVSKVDANRDGLIDLEEFREIYESVVAAEGDAKSSSGEKGGGEEEEEGEMDLKEAFDVFDGNGDGVISAEELGLVLSSLGLRQGGRVEDCHDMIRKVDEDGDGMVNFEEFKKMMVVKGNDM